MGEAEVNIVQNVLDPYTVAICTKTSREVPTQESEVNRAARRKQKKDKQKAVATVPTPSGGSDNADQ